MRMRRLDFYLAKNVVVGVLAALFIIAAVDWLGDFFYQVSKMSSDDQVSRVLIVTLLDFPHKLHEFLPSSLLIGVLLSLGQLAASSELVAVGASGYSRLRVGLIASVVGCVLILLVIGLVEFYGTKADKFAAKYQKTNLEAGVLVASDESYWLRDQDRFVRIGQAVSQDYLRDVSVYTFTETQGIAWIGEAEEAVRTDNDWQLVDFRQSFFEDDQVSVEISDDYSWPGLFSTNFLRSLTTDPFKLSLRRLNEYIVYLDQNRLDASGYRIAFFKRIAVPFTGLAMLMLALPLVFRPRQLGGMGQRLFFGIVIALIVYVIIEAITNGAVVYQISPIIAAFLPSAILLLFSIFAFRFTR